MRGIEFKKNPINSFSVLRIHYTADPAKDPERDGKEWYEQARKGMPESSFQKEYEIDWFALSGELIYPEFDRNLHIVEPFNIPEDWSRWKAIDPGLRNPTAVLWAAVDKENSIYLYDEYYVAEKTIQEHCKSIRNKENKQDVISLIDPASAGRNVVNKQSARDEFAKYGIFAKPADNDVEVGVNRVKQYLMRDEVTEQPRLYFFSTLVNTIREITTYRWEEITDAQAEKKDSPEKPVKRNDHLMDCLRYILMDNPHYSRKHKQKKYKPYNPHTGY